MRYILINGLLLLSVCVSGQKLDFTGDVTGLQNGTKVILTDLRPAHYIKGKRFHDTATVSEGAFQFNITLPGAGSYALRIGLVGEEPEHRVLYLAYGKVHLAGKRGALGDAEITSDVPYMKDYLQFMSVMNNQEIFVREKELADSMIMYCGITGSYAGLQGHEDMEDRFFAAKTASTNKRAELARTWLAEHPHSDINAFVIFSYLQDKMKKGELRLALDKLSDPAKRSFPGVILRSSLVKRSSDM